VKEYYDTRAPEYDEWYMGLGRFEDIDRPGWDAAVTELERMVTGHFYGHLEPEDRRRFIAEARRVAPELVVIDSALRPGHRAEERQERVLNDGSRFEVYKRYFDAYGLAQELGAGTILLENQYFVAVAHDARSHNAEPTVRSHRSLH
jgi:hypothetical protein